VACGVGVGGLVCGGGSGAGGGTELAIHGTVAVVGGGAAGGAGHGDGPGHAVDGDADLGALRVGFLSVEYRVAGGVARALAEWMDVAGVLSGCELSELCVELRARGSWCGVRGVAGRCGARVGHGVVGRWRSGSGPAGPGVVSDGFVDGVAGVVGDGGAGWRPVVSLSGGGAMVGVLGASERCGSVDGVGGGVGGWLALGVARVCPLAITRGGQRGVE